MVLPLQTELAPAMDAVGAAKVLMTVVAEALWQLQQRLLQEQILFAVAAPLLSRPAGA